MLCIINPASVLRAGGGDKHNLICLCTRTKGLQTIGLIFLFFFFPIPVYFLIILERYVSYCWSKTDSVCAPTHINALADKDVIKMIKKKLFQGRRRSKQKTQVKSLSSNSSKQCITCKYFPGGTVTCCFFFDLSYYLPWIKGCDDGDSEWIRCYIFGQHFSR